MATMSLKKACHYLPDVNQTTHFSVFDDFQAIARRFVRESHK